jgi:hypothetical protein
MMRKIIIATLLGMFTGTANAALFDRGNGMIYDDVLNITWLQNVSPTTATLEWDFGRQWAASLTHSGYSDWRLPKALPVNGSTYNFFTTSYNGTTDQGYNITSVNSELAYMFHVNLGNPSWKDTSGIEQVPFGTSLVNTGPFLNLRAGRYLTETTAFICTTGACSSSRHVYFDTSIGFQGTAVKGSKMYFWAVRDGDVTAVPEPGSWLLILAGLAIMAAIRRKPAQPTS